MIKLNCPRSRSTLDAHARNHLAKKSGDARRFKPNDTGIETAWKSFKRTVARERVEEAIDRYCHAKCAYCERIDAIDIEHFQPKSIRPDRMFCWSNFLRACSNCNGNKRDKYPIDEDGRRLLIDPRVDEPLDYFIWVGISGAVAPNPDPARHARAATTRDILKLNREGIRDERRSKYRYIRFLLSHVVRDNPVEVDTLELLKDELDPSRPYLGMIRQLFLRPEDPSLRILVRNALIKVPEIEEWVRPWLAPPPSSPRSPITG
jgi:uncharacterized protein (TIGR02646 family)